MQITQERREQLLAVTSPMEWSTGKAPCWPDVRQSLSSPDRKWAADRIAEVRLCLAEHRAVPAPSSDWVRNAEQRCALRDRAARLAAPIIRRVNSSFDELRLIGRKTGMSLEDISIARSIEKTSGVPMIDTLNCMKLRSLTRIIVAAESAEKQLAAVPVAKPAIGRVSFSDPALEDAARRLDAERG